MSLPLQDITQFRAVFFDADNTLFTLKESLGKSYSRILGRHGIQVDLQAIDERVLGVWKEFRPRYLNADNGYQTSPEAEKENWFHFMHELLAGITSAPAPDQALEEVYSFYGQAKSRLVINGVQEFIQQIRSRNILTGVISNNDARVRTALQDLGMANLFDFIFPTAELGVKKPSPKVFELVQSKVGMEAQACLYIGDSIELDYFPPQKVGWKTLLFSPVDSPDPELRHFSSYVELHRYFQN